MAPTVNHCLNMAIAISTLNNSSNSLASTRHHLKATNSNSLCIRNRVVRRRRTPKLVASVQTTSRTRQLSLHRIRASSRRCHSIVVLTGSRMVILTRPVLLQLVRRPLLLLPRIILRIILPNHTMMLSRMPKRVVCRRRARTLTMPCAHHPRRTCLGSLAFPLASSTVSLSAMVALLKPLRQALSVMAARSTISPASPRWKSVPPRTAACSKL